MKQIINLTQHLSTSEQREAGVIDLPEAYRKELSGLLTFKELPTKGELVKRADSIYDLVLRYLSETDQEVKRLISDMQSDGLYINEKEMRKLEYGFMIGGAPFFMPVLQEELANIGKPMYAFSQRVVEETTNEKGEVIKTAKFKHLGFVEA